jgi:hypothetical protein
VNLWDSRRPFYAGKMKNRKCKTGTFAGNARKQRGFLLKSNVYGMTVKTSE